MNNRLFEIKEIEEVNTFIQDHLKKNNLIYLKLQEIDEILAKENFFHDKEIKPFKILELIKYLKINQFEMNSPLKGIKKKSLRLCKKNRWILNNTKSNAYLRSSTNEIILDFISHRIDKTTNWFYLLYFITVIVFTGLICSFLGLLSSIDLKEQLNLNGISDALVGYSIVLLTTSAIELIMFSPSKSSEEAKFICIKKAVKMIGIASLIFVLTATTIIYIVNSEWAKFIFGIVLTLFSVALWYISNANIINSQEETTDSKTIDQTTGGENSQLDNEQIELPKDFTYE